MKETNEAELKPLNCPHCGGEVTFEQSHCSGENIIECFKCHYIAFYDVDWTPNQCIAAWNTRHQQSNSDQAIESSEERTKPSDYTLGAASREAEIAGLKERLNKYDGILFNTNLSPSDELENWKVIERQDTELAELKEVNLELTKTLASSTSLVMANIKSVDVDTLHKLEAKLEVAKEALEKISVMPDGTLDMSYLGRTAREALAKMEER